MAKVLLIDSNELARYAWVDVLTHWRFDVTALAKLPLDVGVSRFDLILVSVCASSFHEINLEFLAWANRIVDSGLGKRVMVFTEGPVPHLSLKLVSLARGSMAADFMAVVKKRWPDLLPAS